MTSSGITKIEIIISAAIAVFVIIVNIFVVNYLHDKEDDIVVLSEISQIRSSLEAVHNQNTYYPVFEQKTALNDVYAGTQKLCLSGFVKFTDSCQKEILNYIPNENLNQGNLYYYQSVDNGDNYKIEFNLKTNFNDLGLSKGLNCADNLQITSGTCD